MICTTTDLLNVLRYLHEVQHSSNLGQTHCSHPIQRLHLAAKIAVLKLLYSKSSSTQQCKALLIYKKLFFFFKVVELENSHKIVNH